MSIKFYRTAVLRRMLLLVVLGGVVIALLTLKYDGSTISAISGADLSETLATKQYTANASTQGSALGAVRPIGPVQVLRITLYDVGIVPQQSYARPGLITIAFEDLSGGTTGVIVERADDAHLGGPAGEVRRKENNRHGREELRLSAGHYQLYMADRPENRAELIVEP